jgi:integrase
LRPRRDFHKVTAAAAVHLGTLSGSAVNAVVQNRVATIGLAAATFGAHSLRAGFVTQAFRSGASRHEIMRQTGHKDVATLEIYSRENDPLRHNAVTAVGL